MANSNEQANEFALGIVKSILTRLAGKGVVDKLTKAGILTMVVAKLGQKLKSLIAAGKSGELTDIVNYITSAKIAARTEGTKVPSVLECWKQYQVELGGKTPSVKWEDMTTGQKVGHAVKTTGKTLGVIGAACVAYQTCAEAIKYGADDLKRDDKSILNFIWDTSIPGATVNLVASWFGHGRKAQEKADASAAAGRMSMDSARRDFDKEFKPIEDQAAKEAGLVPRPKEGTTAEYEWRKKVEQQMAGTNDGKWYSQGIDNHLETSGEFNWNTFKDDYSNTPMTADSTSASRKFGLPTVASMEVVLSLGRSDKDLVKPSFIKAVIDIKSINKNSSQTTTWDESDLFKFIHDIAVLTAGYTMLHRAYDLITEYAKDDLATPYIIFAALGIDYDDWKKNRPLIESDMEVLDKQLKVFDVDFNQINRLKRVVQLFKYGYKDGSSAKSQYTVFRLSNVTSWYKFEDNSWNRASLGDGTALGANVTGQSYANFMAVMNVIISDLLSSGKVKDMLACLRPVMPGKIYFNREDYKFSFVYDKEVLAQIENADLWGFNTTTYAVSGAAGVWPTETITAPIKQKKYLNSHAGKVGLLDQVIMQRFQAAKFDSETNAYSGTELVNNYFIYCVTSYSSYIKNITEVTYVNSMPLKLYVSDTSDNSKRDLATNLSTIALLSTFDWHPIVKMIAQVGSQNTTAVSLTSDPTILTADWEDFAVAYTDSYESSQVWNAHNRNANFGLYSAIEFLADKAWKAYLAKQTKAQSRAKNFDK